MRDYYCLSIFLFPLQVDQEGMVEDLPDRMAKANETLTQLSSLHSDLLKVFLYAQLELLLPLNKTAHQ